MRVVSLILVHRFGSHHSRIAFKLCQPSDTPLKHSVCPTVRIDTDKHVASPIEFFDRFPLIPELYESILDDIIHVVATTALRKTGAQHVVRCVECDDDSWL